MTKKKEISRNDYRKKSSVIENYTLFITYFKLNVKCLSRAVKQATTRGKDASPICDPLAVRNAAGDYETYSLFNSD